MTKIFNTYLILLFLYYDSKNILENNVVKSN